MNIASKFTILLLLLLLAPNVKSEEAFEQANREYRESIQSQGPGVRQSNGFVFFSVDLPCFKEQKYSGTRESRAAAADLMHLFEHEIAYSKASEIDAPDVLINEIKHELLRHRAEQQLSWSQAGLLVADEDIGNCTRRRAMAFDLEKFESIKKRNNDIDMDSIKSTLLAGFFEKEDAKFLSEYANQLGLLDLSLAYEIKSQDLRLSLPLALLTEKELKQLKALSKVIEAKLRMAKKCEDECNINSTTTALTYDVSSLIEVLEPFHGFMRFTSGTDEQQKISSLFVSKAHRNFQSGRNPEDIFRDLSVALTFSPNDLFSLNMLGDIARALNQPAVALLIQRRALVVSPLSSKTLLYIAQIYKTQGELELARKYTDFIIKHYAWLIADSWVETEVHHLAKELN